MQNSYLVIANGEPPSEALFQRLLASCSSLVAIDGGCHTCLKYGVEPEIILGDFDSISETVLKQTAHIPQIHLPDQNKTDLEKTLEYLFTSETGQVIVCGALGHRIDHSLTNLSLLCRYPEKVKFETDYELCFALPKKFELRCKRGQTLSIIPIMSEVREIYTKGLKWNLNGGTLNKNFIGISNICLEKKITLSFASGDLLLCLSAP